jgi:mRNA-degrading endonuclease RelE of RelBE toxin-antitoxin system
MSSDDRKVSQTPLFGRKIKKFKKDEKAELDGQVKTIIKNPEIGEEKKGDLHGIKVHKYRHKRQEMLLAYRADESEILLITIGTHENYYRDLKSYLR